MLTQKPSYLTFNRLNYAWRKDIDYRRYPYLYRVGKGEQGVLICEPYKSELIKYWRFKTPTIAKKSSQKIFTLFKKYLQKKDFVGADMARKFLQMGFSRTRRYANYKGGKKYATKDKHLLKKGTGQASKAESAAIFYQVWQAAEKDTIDHFTRNL